MQSNLSFEKKKTVFLLEEIPTDGHSPLKFQCDDEDIYYCKYRVSSKEEELDCLIYEVVCHVLLNELNIPTPEMALVEITEGSYALQDLKKNKLYLKPAVVCFGSKDLKASQLVTELDKISSKTDFEKYKNPNDLIRIALFDLWVGNTDRGNSDSQYSPGRSNNYNLLTKPEGDQILICAFDHGFAFEGENGIRIFNENFMPSTLGKLFNTQFFEDIISYISKESKTEIINDFILSIQNIDVEKLIPAVFEKLPKDWKRHEKLKDKMVAYLSSKDRITKLTEIANKEIL